MDTIRLQQLNQTIKECLTSNLQGSYWVIAEIGELKVNQKGHCYLELIEKKDNQILAKNKATIWSYTYRNLSGWFESITGQALNPGMKILANIIVSYHEVYGLSLNIKDIDANFTLGERARKRKEILDKLISDGVVEMNQRIPLPLVPQRIALVASKSSAGYEDFMNQLIDNPFHYNFKITLFDTIVQGSAAEQSIIEALLAAHDNIQLFDVLVIIRGGGATLDLDCFDSYELVNHVAQYPIPVITGIGHERDETITDIVAHTNLKTPTAVAEFLINGCNQFINQVETSFRTISDSALLSMMTQKNKLEQLAQILQYGSISIIEKHKNNFKRIYRNIAFMAGTKTDQIKTRINYISATLKSASFKILEYDQKVLNEFELKIELLNPLNILKRGYSITRVNNHIIRSCKDIKENDTIDTEFSDGKIKSKII